MSVFPHFVFEIVRRANPLRVTCTSAQKETRVSTDADKVLFLLKFLIKIACKGLMTSEVDCHLV